MATLISDELRWTARQIVDDCGYASAVLSGLAPDARHLDNGGFHCSVEDLRRFGNGNDYSNSRADDRNFNIQYGAAIDVSMSKADMIRAHGRIRAVWADRSDPRRKFVNAINCWDGAGDAIRYDFDAGTAKYASPDHKWHAHSEVHRRYVRDPYAARAVVSIFKGESKTAWIAREETKTVEDDDMNKSEWVAFLASDEGKKLVGRAVWEHNIGAAVGAKDQRAHAALVATTARADYLANKFAPALTAAVAELDLEPAGIDEDALAVKLAGLIPDSLAAKVADVLASRLTA